MNRSVPMWFFLFCLMAGAVLAVLFSSLVLASLVEGRRDTASRAAVAVARFPGIASDVLAEIAGYATGSYKDDYIQVAREETADAEGFALVASTTGHEIRGLLAKAAPGRMAEGRRLLAGAFSIDGAPRNAALLLSPELRIEHVWLLDEAPAKEAEQQAAHRKLVHGLEVMPDGSLIFVFDGGASIQRVDACGVRSWFTEGGFHHAVTLDEAGETAWTFSGVGEIAQVSAADGQVLRRIGLDDISEANPGVDVIGLRRVHPNDHNVNSRDTHGRWLANPVHYNDVEPLPTALAGAYPDFEPGDLLLSSRALNLVFVMDPETLELKWWRSGEVQRQHDPDWLPSGRIMILNNRMSRDYSEIVEIDPATFERSIRLDGREIDFYTRIRGKHQMLPGGGLVVSSPQQGRAFEIDASGEVVLEILNFKPGSDAVNYVISEMRWLPPGFFDTSGWTCETNG